MRLSGVVQWNVGGSRLLPFGLPQEPFQRFDPALVVFDEILLPEAFRVQVI